MRLGVETGLFHPGEPATMSATADLDQQALAKYGLLAAVGLFAVGVLGHLVLPPLVGPLPGWERTMFTDFEVLGIVLGLVSVFGFGIVMPLLE